LLSFYESQGQRISIFAIDQNALPPEAITKVRCTNSGKYEVCFVPAPEELLAMVGEREQTQAILPQFEHFGDAQPRPSGTENDASHSE
jgi:hypothetical protein